MKQIIIIGLLLFSIQTFAQIPAGYYDSATGLEGYTLKTALHNIIKNCTPHSYDNLYNGYATTDVDNYYENDGTVLDMYSENPTGTDPYNYTHNSNHCGNYSDEGDCFNREHLMPQSYFGSNSPMVSDIHFVVPSDGKVNGMRSRHSFGVVGSSVSYLSENGSKIGTCASGYGYSGTVFEPIDEFKGDIARMMFYFVTRYEGQLSGFNPSESENPLDGSEDRGYEQWYLDILMAWHEQDPVSQREIDRNNACYDYQDNRNPFIDHPEWVECVWGTCSGLNFTSTPITSAMETQTYTYNITYNVDAETETLTCPTKPSWLTFTKDEANNTALLTGTPSSSDIGNHNVVLQLDEEGETKTQSFTIVVSAYSNTQDILDIDFSNCPVTNWTSYSVASNHNWDCSTGSNEINGYGADIASDDWFISPAINLDNYNNEVLTFKTWLKYSDDGITDPEVKLKYSTNYSGSGDPSSASWTTLSYTFPTSSQQEVWTNSGDIDFSGITGTNVYLAFHYTSSGTVAGSSAYWKVDDILLQGDVAQSVNNLVSLIKLYPNPAKNEVNIKSTVKINKINVYNLIGKKSVSVSNINKNNFTLNLKTLKNGIYFIEILDTNNNKILKKLIKE